MALMWLGTSALTKMDTRGARDLRVELGLEASGAVCGGYGMAECTFDDAEQRAVERADAKDRLVRTAVLAELERRTETQISRLQALRERVENSIGRTAIFWAEDPGARLILDPGSDLAPLATFDDELASLTALRLAARDGSEAFLSAIDTRLETLHTYLARIDLQIGRIGAVDSSALERVTPNAPLFDRLRNAGVMGEHPSLARWLEQAGPGDQVAFATAGVAGTDADALEDALQPDALLWQGSFGGLEVPNAPYAASAIRYHSPLNDATRWRLFGVALLSLAGFFLLVVSPTVTATETAKEREAGTLPVLRMTGMSADDLVAAMVVGPNVFALTAAGLFLGAGALCVTFTAGPGALLVPLALLAVTAPAIHLMAIGLGDALGQRVNAIVVGALVALGVLGPGVIGASLAGLDVAYTGLLLGPLPAVAASTAEIGGIHGLGLDLGQGALGSTMLLFALGSQLLLGWMCLRSWRRRVEQPWASLFTPIEGAMLAVVSIGASALSLVDLSTRMNAQDFDSLNLLTFLSCSFLVPLLGWLLVTSLRRPARARATADLPEARRAFGRFQVFTITAVAVVGIAYAFVLDGSLMGSAESELMWATLAQAFLLAETAVATFLWVSRRGSGKMKVAFVGGTALLLQIVGIAAVYGIEVEHVARTNTPAWPMLINVEASSYWVAFVVLLWAAGLAIVFAALRRDRSDKQDPRNADDRHGHDDEGEGMPGRRLIH